MITKFDSYLTENSTYKDSFIYLLRIAPKGLQEEVEKTKSVEQNPYWHPEGDVYTHIKLVTNRLENCYHDINLTLSGFFHDLGKIYTTEFNDKKGSWSANGHEDSSVEIIDRYQDWIEKLGGDVELIRYIVANHMRHKHIDDMRITQQITFMADDRYPYIQKFATADYGGTELTCKPINKQEDILKRIKVYKEQEIINKEISAKFNGRLIMDKYPHLKGKELGDAINKFKSSFDNFESYALENSSDAIMNDFDDFIKNN